MGSSGWTLQMLWGGHFPRINTLNAVTITKTSLLKNKDSVAGIHGNFIISELCRSQQTHIRQEQAPTLPRAGSWPEPGSTGIWGLFLSSLSLTVLFLIPWSLFMDLNLIASHWRGNTRLAEAVQPLPELSDDNFTTGMSPLLVRGIAFLSIFISTQKLTGTGSWKCRFLFPLQNLGSFLRKGTEVLSQ